MKNKRIAVFTNGWSNEFINRVLEGIREGAKQDECDIFVFTTYIFAHEEEKQTKSQLNIFHLPDPKKFDGAIVFTNTFNIYDEQERVCALFQRAGVPMISTEVKIPGMPFVETGNYEGVYNLAKHLVDVHNVKDVFFIGGIKGNAESAIREKALSDALSEYGLSLMGSVNADFSYYGALVAVNDYFAAHEKAPDAFVCANDCMAMGVYKALMERGYRIPKDVIVTGFDYISEVKCTFPLLATVSRRWEMLGEIAYAELKEQMEKPNPDFEFNCGSEFLPSESCGCEASKDAVEFRLAKIRNLYSDSVSAGIHDIVFRGLRLNMAKVENEMQFYEAAVKSFGTFDILGEDYYICVEPAFLEVDDDDYPVRVRGYSKKMLAIFGKDNGNSVKPFIFDSASIYPGFEHKTGESNLYILAPMNYMDFVIGYVAIKNNPASLYDMSLRKWTSNMDTLFLNFRTYIFAQKTNRLLKKIYMTDALTGMYNRTGCERVLYAFLEERKKAGQNAVLLFADIDRMKVINDVYGHLNGDLAIKATADAMKSSLPEGWLFGRYGGDEFIAVGACQDSQMVPLQRQYLDETMKTLIASYNLNFRLSVSVGYSIITPEDNGNIDDYIRQADKSMYNEKEKAHQLIDAGLL